MGTPVTRGLKRFARAVLNKLERKSRSIGVTLTASEYCNGVCSRQDHLNGMAT